MKQNLPTVAAFVMLAISLTIAFFFTVRQAPVQKKSDFNNDVEIIINKSESKSSVSVSIPEKSIFIESYAFLSDSLKANRKYIFAVIDSYEVEIGDFWREVLNKFEYFEYYKSFPEAFIRRLIFMPTFTGNKELSDEAVVDDKPVIYPDNDYRSFKYRASLVPDTIRFMKDIVDFFFLRLKICLFF